MVPRFRLPMFVVAAALLALMVVFATLQYKWLGRISDAERERMTANLAMHSGAAAQEFDRELTRAYATFQLDFSPDANLTARLASQYDGWATTAPHPRMIKNIFIVGGTDGKTTLQRFNPTSRFVEPSDWPHEFAALRAGLAQHAEPPQPALPQRVVVRTIPVSVWPDIPALVVAAPMLFINTVPPGRAT